MQLSAYLELSNIESIPKSEMGLPENEWFILAFVGTRGGSSRGPGGEDCGTRISYENTRSPMSNKVSRLTGWQTTRVRQNSAHNQRKAWRAHHKVSWLVVTPRLRQAFAQRRAHPQRGAHAHSHGTPADAWA